MKHNANTLSHAVKKLHSLAVMGSITAGLIHDLSNLATILEMSVGNFKDDPTTTRSIKRLSSLIKATKDQLAHQDTKTSFSPVAQIESSLSFLEAEIRAHHIKVETDYRVRSRLEGHPASFFRIVTNLLINAIEAKAQHIEIELSQRDGRLILEINDDGAGVAPPTQEKIFEPLFTTKPEGTGLGLAITKELVDEFGGQISVRSKQGHGTSFEVVLPTNN